MKFGSWTYDGFRLDLVPEGHPEGCDGDIKKFIRHGEWDLISMPCSRNEVIYKCCPEPYPDHLHNGLKKAPYVLLCQYDSSLFSYIRYVAKSS